MNLAEAISKTILKEDLRPEGAAGFGGMIDSDDYLYRSLSTTIKDQSSYKFERSLKISYWMYLTNPLAKRIIEITKDFVIGNGISYESSNEKVKALLDSFWFDSYNNFPIKQHQKISELAIYGEQIYPVNVNKENGAIRLGYIDPLNVKDIITSENNIEDVQQIKIKGKGGNEGRTLNIIKDENGKLQGDVFFFRINNVSNALRGVSDLLPLIDFLDMLDQSLVNEVDRSQLMKSFIWDVTLQGKSEDDIRKWMQQRKVPKPNSIEVHNEGAIWNAVTPDLKISDSIKLIQFVLEYILGGVGIPGHYYGFGQQTNKSTAQTMDMPFLKRLETRQAFIRDMFSQIFQFVIDMAVLYEREIMTQQGKGLGKLTEKEDKSFEVILPEPSTKDIGVLADSLVPLTNALTVAKQNNWISNKTAQKTFTMVLKELGQEVDLEAEEKLIQEESAAAEVEDYNKVVIPEEI